MLAKAAACFVNSRGGSVVVGVHDRTRGVEAFVGCDLDATAIKRRIFELTEPGLAVESFARADVDLLVITVPSSPAVDTVGGRAPERAGTSCEPMTASRIATVVADRTGDDWSAHDSTLDLGSADPVALAGARTLLDRVPDPARRTHAQRSDIDLLRVLGVVTARQALLNAGALLFCAAVTGVSAEIAYVFRRTPSGGLVVNERVPPPMITAIQRVFDLVDARLDRTSVNVGGGQQLQIADLPEGAWREVVVNAAMHRDYRRAAHIIVEHAPTRFAVASPGPFVTGVTPQNVLTTSPRARNQQLAAAMRMLGLAEAAGTGVNRMYAEMARVGHQPPVYTADTEQVQVTLLGGAPNTHLARFTATLPREEAEDANIMLILLMLLGRRAVNSHQMAPVMQRAETEAQTVLARLASDSVGLIETTRESARHSRPNYRLRGAVLASLGPAVAYQRRTPDEYDRKIVGLVREAGQINGRMVKLLLDLDTEAASRALRDLVERQVLVKTSKAQRGPGVTYGRGPLFPRQTPRSVLGERTGR